MNLNPETRLPSEKIGDATHVEMTREDMTAQQIASNSVVVLTTTDAVIC
jgi:hypothetical protein